MFSCAPSTFATSIAEVGCALLCSAVALSGQPAGGCDPSSGMATLLETVTDRVSRVPLAGAIVTAGWGGNGDQQVRVRTDSLGQAVICAPAGRAITLAVSYYDLRISGEQANLTLAHPTTHTYVVDVPGVFVRGGVLDRETGTPLPNVAVRIANTRLVEMTDGDGRFLFERLPLGDHSLRVEHISYATFVAGLNVGKEDLDATIRLTPQALPMEPMIVTAFSRRLEHVGFYERQKRGVGTFVNRRQIDAMNVQSAADLLRSVPSMRLVPTIPRRNAPRTSTTGRGNCRYRFIVDGSRTLADFEMDFLAAYAIEGIEVYNGLAEVPALFRSVASQDVSSPPCGIIAIWTRNSR